MLDLAKLTIKVESKDVRKASTDLTSLEKHGKKAETATRGLAKGFATMGAAIGGVALVGKFTSDLFSVNMEFQKLSASMETVTGSSAAAEEALSWIEKFATETPYQLDDVVGGFVKLKALGLDPSEGALRSYGNTASAMGKSLNQMIEAVADAATGEFERLKEFGIKSKSEGDNVTFTFQGVKTTVKKEAGEIEAYLRTLGDVQFAGAMTKQMDTIGGALSNLKDNYAKLLREIGSSGVNGALQASIQELSNLLTDPDFKESMVTFGENIARMIPLMADAAIKTMELFNWVTNLVGAVRDATEPLRNFLGLGAEAVTLADAGGGFGLQTGSSSFFTAADSIAASSSSSSTSDMSFKDRPSFAAGSDYIPKTGMYQLHQGERVVPAAENSTTGNNKGSQLSIQQVNINVTGINNPRELAKTLKVELERLGTRQLATV